VIGPLMAYEVLTAFFLEAGFPRRDAVRLSASARRGCISSPPDGRDRHADLGVLDLSANSWMQTPTGYAINADGPVRRRPTGST
jgi:cytochrome d ubiquinol oxidase subunit I